MASIIFVLFNGLKLAGIQGKAEKLRCNIKKWIFNTKFQIIYHETMKIDILDKKNKKFSHIFHRYEILEKKL